MRTRRAVLFLLCISVAALADADLGEGRHLAVRTRGGLDQMHGQHRAAPFAQAQLEI